MMPEEKEQLLAFLDHERRWCRDAEAHDANSDAVRYDDDAAVAWDVTGALCRLFGWQRACVLFGQLDRHINGKRVAIGWPARDAEMDAMCALQDFNDRVDMTFDMMRERIETVPVWQGNARRIGGRVVERRRLHDADVS
jgi:hypothetical protein